MEGQDKSTYASTPFKFIIDGNPLYIHAALVSQYSKPLDRLMNGHMAEAQKGFAVLEDVDLEAFTRFIQWAYSGYYSAPDIDMVVAGLSSEGAEEEGDTMVHRAREIMEDAPIPEPIPGIYDPSDDGWGSWGGGGGRKVSKKSKKISLFADEPPTESSAKDTLKESFIKHKTTVPRESIAIPPPRINKDPHGNYTNIFLTHAQLYVFADKYDIPKLKLLALEELHAALANFILHSERTGDIVNLLRYIYGNSGESVPGVEDLRTLITHYLGFEMDTLMKDESFKELMIDDGGPLLGDFMSMVAKRI